MTFRLFSLVTCLERRTEKLGEDVKQEQQSFELCATSWCEGFGHAKS